MLPLYLIEFPMNLDDNDKWPFSFISPNFVSLTTGPFFFVVIGFVTHGWRWHEPRDRETNFRAANRTHTQEKRERNKNEQGYNIREEDLFLFFGRRRRLFRYLSTTLADVVDYESIKGLFSRSFALDSSS
jgi:hypothetical protein